jgi:beta-glucanase (GH16 family)
VTARVSFPRATARTVLVIALVAMSATLGCHADQQASGNPYTYPQQPPGPWRMVWNDEFDGSTLDSTKWVQETGGNGWGNAELEYYTNGGHNVSVANGYLVIEARAESYGGRAYTSARLKTQGLGAWKYGRFEARIKIPRGQGLWPAFWMLGDNIPQVGWPTCGEIDIMENIGKEPSTVHGTMHGPGYSGASGISSPYALATGAFADTFHVFAVEWEPNTVRWYVDSALYKTVSSADVPGTWVFDHPFFILLNVAVGGYWPGNPDGTTVFPQTMRVDYVRVYTR